MFMGVFHHVSTKNCVKMHFFCNFLGKCLVVSEKSPTFASHLRNKCYTASIAQLVRAPDC